MVILLYASACYENLQACGFQVLPLNVGYSSVPSNEDKFQSFKLTVHNVDPLHLTKAKLNRIQMISCFFHYALVSEDMYKKVHFWRINLDVFFASVL